MIKTDIHLDELTEKSELLKRLHEVVLSAHPKIEHRLFPIYIVYSLGEQTVALIYYKGKLVKEGGLYIGLHLNEPPKNKKFVSAADIKYLGITHGAHVKNVGQLTPQALDTIRAIGRI
ncbi:MAG: hypothetical protein A3J30_02350 [Candidatus Wildermuthbacteria bacterium RIFCSPLOWO2_02_FULL_47_9c]|uniref:YdhG-like domain-containing protein n=2 Tax=Parcubacteria group TaxID=1794811 RepID=A0A837IQ43_9BACT|nr:MAG: hypothetical protein UY25_C0002G0172 [Candidatus Yanofskybacteria bacterium GW2011_GWC1_48_11]KKW04579.1 MAG: hypothetical protein UY38_C0001G0146 [Parcubacteria group bacterium GW2011_GWB1_49_12]KKW09163.1 MAG: hypothetical protein UY45_C0001G0049 [Parcubacteria group bacterium GW2011_GWA1_49_26]KKW13502.1 MAG: hypothetical protein UY53_C0012G0020 [Parcubacteria group bacterium GW2011_GWA2_50_10]OHA61417.1 MAG: hypothetical protein A2109_00865 [Candidatus Wildermuthbacteria bacterium G